MRFSLVLALLPILAACNTTNSTSGNEKTSTDQEFEVVTLKYASATALANTIEGLVEAASRVDVEHRQAQPGGAGSRGQRSETVRVLADQRTNSLLVTAPAANMVQIKDLIALLDVDVTK